MLGFYALAGAPLADDARTPATGVTVALTGQSISAARGTLTPDLSKAATGQALALSGSGAGDASFSSTAFLAGYNGTNGSTSFTDESSVGRALTTGGNAQISTAQSKFGGSSLLLDGTGDYCEAADSADWAFGSGQFTIEAFLRKTDSDSEFTIASQWSDTSQTTNAAWAFFATTGNLIFRIFDSGGTQRDLSIGFTPTTNVWHHYAVDRDATGNDRDLVKPVRGPQLSHPNG